MEALGIVRRMFFRDGLSVSEIERCTGLTRNTSVSAMRMTVIYVSANGHLMAYQ